MELLGCEMASQRIQLTMIFRENMWFLSIAVIRNDVLSILILILSNELRIVS